MTVGWRDKEGAGACQAGALKIPQIPLVLIPQCNDIYRRTITIPSQYKTIFFLIDGVAIPFSTADQFPHGNLNI